MVLDEGELLSGNAVLLTLVESAEATVELILSIVLKAIILMFPSCPR
jgi:hypothetical protein